MIDLHSILLVEDSRTDALLISEQLVRSLGLSVKVATVERLAVAMERIKAFPPDLILLDLSLPDSCGLETLCAIRQAAPRTAIVVLTHTDDPDIAEEAIRQGAQDYLVKGSFNEDLLRRTLRYAFERQLLKLEIERHTESTVLRTIAECNVDGVLLLDERMHVTYANPAAQRMLGKSPERLTGAPLGFSIHDGATVSLGDGERAELRLEMRVAPVEFSGKRLYLVALRDVTERVRLEEKLRQSQKMEAVGRLAGGVAHDFNNLLTVLMGRAELLKAKFEPQDTRLDDVNLISGVGERAAVLTRQLLTFSRQQVFSPQVVQVNELIGSLIKMLRRIVPENIHLETRLDPAAPKVCVDPGQLDQVLMNLIINARDAISGEGRIFIETGPTKLDVDFARKHPDTLPGEYLKLTVQDTGCGMDQHTIGHVFEPFFTTKAVGKGTGLGLATTYGIVQQSGGHITVESEPGHGARFCVYLPASDDPMAKEFSPEDLRRELGGNGTVLVVDDDPIVADMICETLGGCGYKTVMASKPREAQELADGMKIDALVTDIVMPEMSGTELARHMLERHPNMRVLYISGYTELDASQTEFRGKRIGFLQKAFTPRSLLVKMREMFQPIQDALD